LLPFAVREQSGSQKYTRIADTRIQQDALLQQFGCCVDTGVQSGAIELSRFFFGSDGQRGSAD
jgi:hypothetical protein